MLSELFPAKSYQQVWEFDMLKMSLVSAVLLFVILSQGCTLHFKAEKLEVESERQRVMSNKTYNLEKIELFDG